ncbi:hypothetical protein M8J77_004742 [Diaphorina citri]|nr:hypothetical protein M8J77_001381 [Diaphorina citri]KAI5717371.1 hypothetical protein M8J77_004742 [Diaphorina citri]
MESFHRNRRQIVRLSAGSCPPVDRPSGSFNSLNPVNPTTITTTTNSVYSDTIDVTSGCIQGGHLSGVLFLCFVNDIVSVLSPDVRGWLFADDFKIAIRVRGPESVLQLREVLQGLHRWCLDNLMELNTDKCKVMSFYTKKNPIIAQYSINNVVLERVDQIKDLGVTMEKNLKFNTHYKNVASKAYKMLGFLYRHTQDFKNTNVLKTLYYSYVRSHLEYCSVVWSPQYQVHINTLEAVQKKFLRLLAYKDKTPILDHNYEPIMSSHNIVSLQHRRDIQDLTFLYKLLHNLINSPELLAKLNLWVNSRNTRSHLTFKLTKSHTNVGEFSPLQRFQSMGNKASDVGLDLFVCSLSDIVNIKL